MPAERILIFGDRHWQDDWNEDNQPIRKFVESLPKDTIIIEGEAPGADRTAGDIAQECGLQVLESEPGVRGFPAKWEHYGRRAGPIRNQQMIDEGKPTRAVGFHDDIENNSKGSAEMKRRLEKAGIPVEIRTHDD